MLLYAFSFSIISFVSPCVSGNEITQDKHSKLEKSLVDIGAANLREKTDILSEHSQLSQSLSQLELSEGREELKERLTGLAARQKKLLACLTRQKKITAKLSEKRKQQDTRPSNSQRAITAGSTRDVLSRHHSLTAGQSVPQQTYLNKRRLLQSLIPHLESVLSLIPTLESTWKQSVLQSTSKRQYTLL